MTSMTGQPLMEENQGATVIRTPDQRVRVFISSTLQELAEERQAAREAIKHLRLTPVLFELGARPHPPRPLYRAYLAQSDIFIGIYWQRYGWIAPGEEISGLEDEFLLSGHRPKLIYVKSPAPEREPGLVALLDRIRDNDGVSYKPFRTARELRELVENDLALVLTESFAQARSPGSPQADELPHDNLPVQRSPLIDRVRETAVVRELLLRDDVGLVTLTGAGGTGKTRLALHVASIVRDNFEHGVIYVSLGPLSDAALLVPAVAGSLGLRESPGQPLLDALLAALRPKCLLLVLDNFEHLLAVVPVLGQLLEHCPHLTVLVTSRAPLHLREEHEVAVPPLAVPDVYALPEAARLSQYAAVELFTERAREVKPDFAVSNETAPAVAEICQRLDGLPLAIELAAARVRVFPPKALLARLERRLPVLVTGARDLPERQQTLRQAIEWSYDLLRPEEQSLFWQLSVFVGGFTLTAAQTVCSADGRETTTPGEDRLLQGVEQLMDKSLLWVQEGFEGEPRFGMLETIREFGRMQLAASGEEDVLIRRHARWCLGLAEEAEPHLTGPSRGLWLQRLDVEQDNVRAALRRSLWEDRDVEVAARLAASLTWFWFLRGRLSEERDWMQRTLSVVSPQTPSKLRARLLFGVGMMAWAQGDLGAARHAVEESVRLLRGTRDRLELGLSLMLLGVVAEDQGESSLSRTWSREGLNLARETGDQWSEGFGLYQLGRVELHVGNLDEAQDAYREGLPIFERLGDPWGRGLLMHGLGEAAAMQHEYDTAYRFFKESLSLFSQLHDPYARARAIIAMAGAAIGRREYAQAERLWRESLTLWNNLGNALFRLVSLAGLAETALRQGRQERAAQFFGSVARQLEELGEGSAEGIAQIYAEMRHAPLPEILAEAKTELGDGIASDAWKRGASMSLDQTITHALGDDRAPKPAAKSPA